MKDSQVFAATNGDHVSAVIWDFEAPEQKISNPPFYSHIVPAEPGAPAAVSIKNLKPGSYRLTVRRTGFRANDAYSAYLNMGLPKSLTPAQLQQLNLLTRDLPEMNRTVHVGNSGACNFSFAMRSNDVVLVSLERIKQQKSSGMQ